MQIQTVSTQCFDDSYDVVWYVVVNILHEHAASISRVFTYKPTMFRDPEDHNMILTTGKTRCIDSSLHNNALKSGSASRKIPPFISFLSSHHSSCP
jgi:hypothetical protein